MNIDIDKLKEMIANKQLLDVVLECEVKPVKTDLDKLFPGAPVMVVKGDNSSFSEVFVKWQGGKFVGDMGQYSQGCIRLPTVEESPRNIWLSPWSKFQKELIGKRMLIWWDGDFTLNGCAMQQCDSTNVERHWDKIGSLKILEDFKS